jgi:K+-transporting ATPase ATPase C chain
MKELWTALRVLGIFSLLVGVLYPLLVLGIAQVAFSHRANGSLISVDERVVGSELVGQSFSLPQYLHGRPSSSGYDPMSSGGSNLAPSNPVLLDRVREDVGRIRAENGLALDAVVPADLVLASGSGLDPDLSVEAALLQAERIAAERGIAPETVRTVIQRHVQGPFLSAFGDSRVNVLRVNLALDALPSATGGLPVSSGGSPRGAGEESRDPRP